MRLDFAMASIIIALAMLLVVAAVFILTRRERLLGLRLVGLMMIATAVYSATYAWYLFMDDAAVMLASVHIGVIALSFVMPLWFLMTRQQARGTRVFHWKMTFVVGAVPALAMVALALYPWRETPDASWWSTLFFAGHETVEMEGNLWHGFTGIVFEKGLLYFVLAGYYLLLAVLSAIGLGRIAARREGVARRRSTLLFMDALLVVALCVFELFGGSTPLVDPTPILIDLVPLLAFLALFKYELFDLVPEAYHEMFRKSDHPTVILDVDHRIVALNPAAERYFGKINRGPDDRFDLALLHRDGGSIARELYAGHECEIESSSEGKPRWHKASLTPLGRSKKRPSGYFVTYQDVTAHKNEMRHMEEMANYDDLTRIYNRRYFFRKATALFDEAVATRKNVRVTMFDLDDFKEINDIYGHQAGDAILAQLAKVVVALVRPEDVFARYGGEEFIIFGKDVDDGVGRAIERTICEAISSHPFVYQRRTIRVTGSFGVAGSRGAVEKPLERYIKEADDALYVSKIAGKNQVSYSPDLK